MMDQQQTNQLTNKQEKLHFQIMFCLCLGSIVLTLNSHQSQFMHKSITTLSENKYLLKFQPHISKQDQCKFKINLQLQPIDFSIRQPCTSH